MLDIRYHIASLTAVFLALGFGILIGSSYAGPAAIRSMSVQIQRQNERLDNAVQLNEQDHALLKQNEDAIAALVPKIVQNQLAGKHIALVQAGDYPDAVKYASDAISQAGGTVVSTTELTGRFDMLSDTDRQRLAKALNSGSADDNALLRPLALSVCLGTSAHPDLESELESLEQSGAIARNGDYSGPANMVVVVGGSAASDAADSGQTHEEQLIALLKEAGSGKAVALVGCEPRDAVQSSVPIYLRAGISSVDCIDQPLGALDLPFALIGESSAYGVKPTADRLIPPSLEVSPAPSA
ncbi:MAG TPA: copper transporter [Capsulimonadaceae bacterium]|nr:copper transporter [Capsulimonadaceae bacterium]